MAFVKVRRRRAAACGSHGGACNARHVSCSAAGTLFSGAFITRRFAGALAPLLTL